MGQLLVNWNLKWLGYKNRISNRDVDWTTRQYIYYTDKMIKSVRRRVNLFDLRDIGLTDISNPKVVLEIWYNETCACSVSTESLKTGSEKNSI